MPNPNVPNMPQGPTKDKADSDAPPPAVVNKFHSRSDVDSGQFSQHHTLGIKHDQAAAGDHIHDGRASKQLSSSSISDFDTQLATKADSIHTHAETDVTSLVTDLAGKAPTSHTHSESQVTNLVTDLAAKADVAQPAWTDLTLGSSWVNYGSGYANAGFFKDTLGIVHLRGLIKSGTSGVSFAILPSGYRPSNRAIFMVFSYTGVARVDVDTAGNIYVMSYASGGSNADVSLEGITFRAV